jgi:hypothetical protein
MRANDKKSWTEAVVVDHLIRDGINQTAKGNKLYLHRSRVPLDEADLSDPAENQQTFSFMDECDGMCGV